jgi:hypothetical protein
MSILIRHRLHAVEDLTARMQGRSLVFWSSFARLAAHRGNAECVSRAAGGTR